MSKAIRTVLRYLHMVLFNRENFSERIERTSKVNRTNKNLLERNKKFSEQSKNVNQRSRTLLERKKSEPRSMSTSIVHRKIIT